MDIVAFGHFDDVTLCAQAECQIRKFADVILIVFMFSLRWSFVSNSVHCFSDRDMGARHRARASSIQIMKVQVIAANKVKSKNLKQFLVSFSMLQLSIILPSGSKAV